MIRIEKRHGDTTILYCTDTVAEMKELLEARGDDTPLDSVQIWGGSDRCECCAEQTEREQVEAKR